MVSSRTTPRIRCRIGAGMGLRVWRGGDFTLNYERVVAKPSAEPYAGVIGASHHQAVLVVIRILTDSPLLAQSGHP